MGEKQKEAKKNLHFFLFLPFFPYQAPDLLSVMLIRNR